MVRPLILAALLAAASGAAPAQDASRAHDDKLFASPALATPYRDNLSDDEKVAGLSKFWSEVKYNFIYVDKLKALDWDQLYLDYLPKVRATASTAEYYKVLMELCARLQDGHTNVYPAQQVWDTELASPKIRTRLVEGRVLVTDVLDPALAAQGVRPGVEVAAVDGEPAVAYGKRVHAPYQSASTPQDLDTRAFGYAFLSGPLAKAPRITFQDGAGKRFDVALQRYDMAAVRAATVRRPPFELRMLPGGVAYVALNSFGSDAAADGFLAAFDQIAGASALVIDLRNNGGGNSNVGYRVLATLTGKPFATGRWATRKYLPASAGRRPGAHLHQGRHLSRRPGLGRRRHRAGPESEPDRGRPARGQGHGAGGGAGQPEAVARARAAVRVGMIGELPVRFCQYWRENRRIELD